MINNKKGIALIVVLILSAIALALVGITLNLVRSTTKISGLYGSYQSSLEAAKGGVDMSIAKLLSLNCDNSTLSGNLALQYSQLGNYSIKANILKKYHYITIDVSGTPTNYCIYAIEVTATSTNGSKDKSIIDTVIKVD